MAILRFLIFIKALFKPFPNINQNDIFFSLLEKTLVKTQKRIAFGFSLSALPLLERLQARKYVDQIFISDISDLSEDQKIVGLMQSKPIDFLKDHWQNKNKLIFVGSVGAVVRLISPFVRSKAKDPAILVMDAKAKNVIPLLGGHKKGGDSFANELADAIEPEVICTSDSFTERRIPLDCFGKGWGWERGGGDVDWRKLMISQSKNQKNIVFQSKGEILWQKLKGCSNISFLEKNDPISFEE